MLGLRYKEDLRTLAFCFLYFALVTWQWRRDESVDDEGGLAAAALVEKVALFALTTFFAFIGAVSVHNNVHTPPFHSKLANTVFQVLLSLWFGHAASAYVPGHNLSHHKYLQTPKDVMRTDKMRFRWHLLNGLLFMPFTLPSTSRNDATYFSVQRQLGRPIYNQVRVEMGCYVTLQLVCLCLDPLRWLRVFFLPQTLGKYMIISLNMLQHDGCDPTSKYNHSRNFVGSVANFFFLNNGYHTIHHMYPGKHWSLLPAEHEKRVKPYIHPNLDVPSMLGYVFTTFIYPAVRTNYDGTPYTPTVEGSLPDEPWFYADNETYSKDDLVTYSSSPSPVALAAEKPHDTKTD